MITDTIISLSFYTVAHNNYGVFVSDKKRYNKFIPKRQMLKYLD